MRTVGTFGRIGPGHPLYMEWMKRAECVHEDPELFFPVGSSGPALRDQERAKGVCRRCPVAAQCLDWAVNVGRPIGVWGGTTEHERERLRRRRANAR